MKTNNFLIVSSAVLVSFFIINGFTDALFCAGLVTVFFITTYFFNQLAKIIFPKPLVILSFFIWLAAWAQVFAYVFKTPPFFLVPCVILLEERASFLMSLQTVLFRAVLYFLLLISIAWICTGGESSLSVHAAYFALLGLTFFSVLGKFLKPEKEIRV